MFLQLIESIFGIRSAANQAPKQELVPASENELAALAMQEFQSAQQKKQKEKQEFDEAQEQRRTTVENKFRPLKLAIQSFIHYYNKTVSTGRISVTRDSTSVLILQFDRYKAEFECSYWHNQSFHLTITEETASRVRSGTFEHTRVHDRGTDQEMLRAFTKFVSDVTPVTK